MKILHITDLHYNSESFIKFSQYNIIEKTLDYIKNIGYKIDLIIFSGDLVYNGSNYEDFNKAKENFLLKLSLGLNISTENIIICAGNHDMNRKFKSPSLEEKFSNKINTTDELYYFFKNKDYDLETSLRTTENYNLFRNEFYENSPNNKLEILYAIHRRNIDGKDIAIISLNSAWRSVDDNSLGNLLFPNFLLEEIFFNLKDIECKLAVLHHPISWFKDFNQTELQKIIYKNCNIIFSGHIHEAEITTHYKQNNGIFTHISPASFTWDENLLGFSIISYNLDNESSAEVFKYHYIKEKESFDLIEKISVKVPCGKEKEEQNRLREKINNKFLSECLNAKDLLLSNDLNDYDDEQFLSLFNFPTLKTKTKQETEENKKNVFDFSLLLSNQNNYVIYGDDKSGKSSLLKYIQIYHIKNYSIHGIIPYYVDLKDNIKNNLFDSIRKYYGLSKDLTKELLNKHKFSLLLDNYDNDSSYCDEVNFFLSEYKNVNFIFTTDKLTSRIYDNLKIDGRNYEKLYLEDIKRSDVRLYINKIGIEKNSKNDELLENIITFCKQIELPLSYWSISLILMIHKKSKIDISKNIFSLLDLCVDEILQKKYNTLKNSRVSFNQLKSISGNIAKFLLINNQHNNSCKKYSEVLNELEEYFKINNRIKASPKEVLDYLIESGLLKLRDNNLITFRLNGIFEYFVAFKMSEDLKFRNQVLDDTVYLSFKNELEIYSGIKNNDIEFLKTIFKKTNNYFLNINNHYKKIGNEQDILLSKVSNNNDINLKKIISNLNPSEPLENDRKDLIKDEVDPLNSLNSNVNVKKTYDVKNLTPEIFERYIAILARVFKTMDGNTDLKLQSKILNLLLDTYINFGFYLFETLEEEIKLDDNYNDNTIINLISKILPLITQLTMSENISQHNVENILIDKINQIKNDKKNNQYKLFILYLILMDIDENNIFKFADELINNVEIGILKYSAIVKLNYYFSFNGSHNKNLAQFLKDKIKKAQLKLNKKTDKDLLQSSLDKKMNKF